MAKDLVHQSAKNALIKDNWIITHDPYTISYGGVNMSVDLGAEKLIAATKDNQKIAVEIKSFLEKSSAISEFHTALGQFINYRAVLKRKAPDRTLFLAIPSFTYDTFFSLEFTQLMVTENQLKLIVFEPNQEVITQWIN
ncbi:MAG TPA: fatty-acid oxidation protein subunit alpha [Cyanothece sp. UBA12306]|nr:fatty-acid oxidation protein subunit alpha [Cyanothece sp. UBA12306]